MLKIDGYDDCIAGVVSRAGQDDILVYDKAAIITKIIMECHINFDDAMEHFEFNIGCAYMGEGTPCFIEPYEPEV